MDQDSLVGIWDRAFILTMPCKCVWSAHGEVPLHEYFVCALFPHIMLQPHISHQTYVHTGKCCDLTLWLKDIGAYKCTRDREATNVTEVLKSHFAIYFICLS